jgi:hypothetical protein
VEQPVRAESGVVDQAGHRDAALGHRGGEFRPRARLGQVHADHRDGDPGQLGGQLLQPVGAPGDEHQAGTAGGQAPGEEGSEPGTRAGDQGGLVLKVDGHGCHAMPIWH